MEIRANPYLRLLPPFCLGIALAENLAIPISMLITLLLCSGLAVLFWARRKYAYQWRWWFGFCLFIFLVSAGLFRGTLHDERSAAAHFTLYDENSFQKQELRVRVEEPPQPGKNYKLVVQILRVRDSLLCWQSASARAILYLKTDTCPYQYGDELLVRAGMRKPEAPKNPDAFDYQRYLHFRNIHLQAFTDKESVALVSRRNGNPLWQIAYHFRARLLELLHRYFPTANEFAVASALLAGYRAELPDELREAYADTGSMHALAVSGTHVGILYAGLLLLLGKLPFRGRWGYWTRTVLILSGIWGFALVTGGSPSVLRAAVMFSCFLIGKAIRKESSIWNVLSATAFGLLLVNPWYLFDLGFQLSFSAVAGIVFFYPRLYKQVPVMHKFLEGPIKVLLVGVAAQLGTLPLSLYYFHQFPCYFWLAGWVVVLGGALFLWGGSILVLLDSLAPSIAEYLGDGLYYLLRSMNFLIEKIQLLPGSVIKGIWLTDSGFYLLLISFFLFAACLATQKTRLALFCLLGFCLLALRQAAHRQACMKSEKIVVYHNRKGLLIDCFSGGKVWQLSNKMAPKQIKYASEMHRMASGCLQVSTFHSDPKQGMLNKPPFYYFQGQTVLIPSNNSIPANGPKASLLILDQNPSIDLASALDNYPVQQLIITAANRFRNQEKWENICYERRIPCYRIDQEGAYILTLENP